VGEVTVDFAAVMERTAQVVAASQQGLRGWITRTPGVSLVPHWATLDGRDGDRFVVRAGTRRFLASRVYLNPGTRPLVPDIPGLDQLPWLTNETVLQLRERPRHLVILGGSYIGLELGQAFRRLGSEVTILEAGPTIAAREDADIVASLTTLLRDEGVEVLTRHVLRGVAPGSVSVDGRGIDLTVFDTAAEVERTLRGSHLLVATGRRPNSERLGLPTVGVHMDGRGFIPTDGTLATNVPGIWALGDINGRGAFTHTSYQDHEIVLANHDGGARSAEGRITAYALYTDPPLGRVGIGEREARQLQDGGRRFLVARHEMQFVSRAKEEGETTGVLKVIVDADTRRFAGASLLGIRADEVVQVIGAMMAADAPFEVLKDALPIHPTVTEFFPTILGKLQPLT
jgi:pyruvate/2-oxoglutarate dehydrogenase complex dihydrolipoamide dehydrogenase (E3) component